MSCVYDVQTTYIHQIWFANCVPLISLCVSGTYLAFIKARPSIGDYASRPVGQMMTNERMERDWLLLGILKSSNMAWYFLIPTVSCSLFSLYTVLAQSRNATNSLISSIDIKYIFDSTDLNKPLAPAHQGVRVKLPLYRVRRRGRSETGAVHDSLAYCGLR